jgi:cbb3-type cytochrome oxidase subunit 3
MDNTENYNQRLENLSKEVDNVTEFPSKNPNYMQNLLNKLNTKYLIIGGIPFIFTIFFIIIKPSFLTKEDKENPDKKKLDFIKIIFTFFVLILLTLLGTYVYNHKKKL